MFQINWSLIRQTCGRLLLLEALFMTLATCVSGVYWVTEGERDLLPLLVPTIGCALTGWLLAHYNQKASQAVTPREGFLVVSLMWVVFSLFGMIPYLLSGTCQTVCDAFLETMSGFTTTGCTILDDIDAQPHGILLWRSLTQWIGGLGIVVFSLALLPKIESGNVEMFSAEVTGMTVDKLRPKIQATARRLWVIYVGLTVVCLVLYRLGGMSVFDAVCHAMTTLATGGFSTHQASIGWFHSAFIEYVCATFLFIASINFSLFYMVRRGVYRQFLTNEELRWFAYIVVGATLFCMILFITRDVDPQIQPERWAAMPHGLESQFRTSLFHVITIISTCGFQAESYDYVLWGRTFWLLTLCIMACGGCAGSTAGGFKVLRVVILIKNLKAMIVQSLMPRSYGAVMLDDHPLRLEYLQRTLAFVFLFFLVSLASIAVMMLQGIDMDTAIGTTISAIGNCGPGLGQTGPAFTWSWLPDLSKWMLSFTMLIGRLEIFTVVLLFTRVFWRRS